MKNTIMRRETVYDDGFFLGGVFLRYDNVIVL